MTFATGAFQPSVYGDWTNGSGTTLSGTSAIFFRGRGTEFITSAGKTFTQPVNIDCVTGTYQLADSFITSGAFQNLSGTFTAANFNVTMLTYSTGTAVRAMNMGSGTWTVTGTGLVWSNSGSNNNHNPGTAVIVLSNTTVAARQWAGGGLYYHRLTIGGTTGISTLTFSSTDTFGELASTKTVAHTLTISQSITIGKWSITGTTGNRVTVTATAAINLRGERVSGVDFLTMGTSAMSTTNPVEFYAGVNSTGTGAGVILTAAPAPVTRYWRGGTGTWDATTTTNWSATSGGAGGASVPTSADTVIFNSASNATAYTVTLTATQLRCASISVSGPAAGNISFNGTAPLSVTQAFTMASTGITTGYSGTLTFAGTGNSKTISMGQTLIGAIAINGVGASWALTSAATTSNSWTITNGSFDTAGFGLTCFTLNTDPRNPVTLSLGASAITFSLNFSGINSTGSTATLNPVALTFNPGTSTININSNGGIFYHGGKTFYNVAITDGTSNGTTPLDQSIFTPTFNNFTIARASGTGFKIASLSSNLIINGTFTVSAGADATRRLFLISDTIGTQRTITAAAVSGLEDIDMRDINCAGAASWTGTRIGDLGGNTNAPTTTPKTVYWNLAGGGNWSSTAWATTSGGTPAINNFPLAQDTAIIENTGLNNSATITLQATWNIGTINMSARTTNSMNMSFTSSAISVYGDWIFGAGVGTSGGSTITFSKSNGTQTITSNGRIFNQTIAIASVNGTVQLADAFNNSVGLILSAGTFNAVSYNVTIASFTSNSTISRTLLMGSGLWSITNPGSVWTVIPPTLPATMTLNDGTADIIFTNNAGAITFAGGGYTYNKLTIGGTTSTSNFTLNDNNTFSEIASTRTAAYELALGTSTQRVSAFTATGTLGNLITISGSAVTTPATLILLGAGSVSVSYIRPTFLRVYDPFSDWTVAGITNRGSYGWLRSITQVVVNFGNFLAFFN